MSEELNQTAAPVESAPADTASEAAVSDSGTFDTVEDIESALLGEMGGEGEAESAEEVQADANAEAEAKTDAENTDSAAAEENIIPMPEGADKAAWDALTPEARSFVHAREQAHAQAITEARTQMQSVQQDRQHLAEAAGNQLQQAIDTMKAITEADYAGINWQALSQQDPATYVQLQQGYSQRMAQIQQITQQLQHATQVYQQRQAQERAAAIKNEFSQVEPQLRTLIGDGYDPAKTRDDIVTYMKGQGCPDRVINSLSRGYELTMVTKAMLYDRMQAARSAAKAKVAEAPVVQAPSGRQASDGNSRQMKAMSALRKNPHSTDALADAFASLA